MMSVSIVSKLKLKIFSITVLAMIKYQDSDKTRELIESIYLVLYFTKYNN